MSSFKNFSNFYVFLYEGFLSTLIKRSERFNWSVNDKGVSNPDA